MVQSVEAVNRDFIHHKDQLRCQVKDKGDSCTLMVVFYDEPVDRDEPFPAEEPLKTELTRRLVVRRLILREVRRLTRDIAEWLVQCDETEKSGGQLYSLSGYLHHIYHQAYLKDCHPSPAERILGMVDETGTQDMEDKDGIKRKREDTEDKDEIKHKREVTEDKDGIKRKREGTEDKDGTEGTGAKNEDENDIKRKKEDTEGKDGIKRARVEDSEEKSTVDGGETLGSKILILTNLAMEMASRNLVTREFLIRSSLEFFLTILQKEPHYHPDIRAVKHLLLLQEAGYKLSELDIDAATAGLDTYESD